MKTLILYTTKHGAAEKCATILSKKLTGKVDRHNLKTAPAPDLTQYDKIILGGSIYVGQIQKELTEFCTQNLQLLKTKKIGLFISCMREGDEAQTQLNTCFPQGLSQHAIAKEVFGGEFNFKKMNFMERFITRVVAKTSKDTSNICEQTISKFAQLINKA